MKLLGSTAFLAIATALCGCHSDPQHAQNAQNAQNANALTEVIPAVPETRCSSPASYMMINAAIAEQVWPPEARRPGLPLVDAKAVSDAVRYERPTIDSIDRDTGGVTCSVDLLTTVTPVAAYAEYPKTLDVRPEGGQLRTRIRFGVQRQADTGVPVLRLPAAKDLGIMLLTASAFRPGHSATAPEPQPSEEIEPHVTTALEPSVNQEDSVLANTES